MVLVKVNIPVHYHVKKYIICRNKICQGPMSFFDGNMVVSAGMAHIIKFSPSVKMLTVHDAMVERGRHTSVPENAI